MDLVNLFSSFSTQTLILAGIVAAIFFGGLRFGRSHVVAALLSLYISSFIYSEISLSKITEASNAAGGFWTYLGTFLLFFIPIHAVLLRVVMTDFGEAPMKYVRALGMAILFTGLLISISYHVIPLLPVFEFSPMIDQLFASDTAFAAWLIVPLIVLFF
jgi:hypothetical protein